MLKSVTESGGETKKIFHLLAHSPDGCKGVLTLLPGLLQRGGRHPQLAQAH